MAWGEGGGGQSRGAVRRGGLFNRGSQEGPHSNHTVMNLYSIILYIYTVSFTHIIHMHTLHSVCCHCPVTRNTNVVQT